MFLMFSGNERGGGARQCLDFTSITASSKTLAAFCTNYRAEGETFVPEVGRRRGGKVEQRVWSRTLSFDVLTVLPMLGT